MPRPVNMLDRERAAYSVHKGNEKRDQVPLMVYIDKPIQQPTVCVGACSKKGRGKLVETGLHKESTLLAAFKEGKTWFILSNITA